MNIPNIVKTEQGRRDAVGKYLTVKPLGAGSNYNHYELKLLLIIRFYSFTL